MLLTVTQPPASRGRPRLRKSKARRYGRHDPRLDRELRREIRGFAAACDADATLLLRAAWDLFRTAPGAEQHAAVGRVAMAPTEPDPAGVAA